MLPTFDEVMLLERFRNGEISYEEFFQHTNNTNNISNLDKLRLDNLKSGEISYKEFLGYYNGETAVNSSRDWDAILESANINNNYNNINVYDYIAMFIGSIIGAFALTYIISRYILNRILKIYIYNEKALALINFAFSVTIIFVLVLLTGFFEGLIYYLSWLIAFLIYDLRKLNYSKCPYCKENIKKDAILCKHCKTDLSTYGMN